MTRILALALTALLLTVAVTAGAEPNFFNNRCASCHSDDSVSCNGCHEHGRRFLNANAPGSPYAPGDPLTVSFSGGEEHGWIRAILYDDANVVQALLTGPTGTGDDGGTDDVTFPVQFQATAPQTPGDYVWQAAWFGGVSSGGGGHLEVRTDVTFTVDDTNTGIDDYDGNAAYSAVKALY